MSSANGNEDLTTQVKAITGPMFTETKAEIAKLKGQLEALESLLNEAGTQEILGIKQQITSLEATLDAKFAGIKKMIEVLGQSPAIRGPEALEDIPVSTKAVADALLQEFTSRYPHPITRVRWDEAAREAGVLAQTLVEALEVLYADKGLDGRCLAVLHRCGWRLALVQPGAAGGLVAPKAWLLETGKSVELPATPPVKLTTDHPVDILGGQTYLDPAAFQGYSPAGVERLAEAITKPNPKLSSACEPKDDSASGILFNILLTEAKQPLPIHVLVQRTGFTSKTISSCLYALAHAKYPRQGHRVYRTADGGYEVRPAQA